MSNETANSEHKKQIQEIRSRLTEDLSTEELQKLKLNVDSLQGLVALDDGHDHDVDTEGHHDHEHSGE
jgi:hypothetical protein